MTTNEKDLLNRLEDSFIKYNEGDLNGAFYNVCGAVDATARKEFPDLPKKQVGKRIRAFCKKYMPVIWIASFGRSVAPGINFPKGITIDDESCYSLEDVIYVLIRCSVIHGLMPPEKLHFSEGTVEVGKDGDELTVPKDICLGLIFAVIASPTNSDLRFDKDIQLSSHRNINEFWGNPNALMRFYRPTLTDDKIGKILTHNENK